MSLVTSLRVQADTARADYDVGHRQTNGFSRCQMITPVFPVPAKPYRHRDDTAIKAFRRWPASFVPPMILPFGQR